MMEVEAIPTQVLRTVQWCVSYKTWWVVGVDAGSFFLSPPTQCHNTQHAHNPSSLHIRSSAVLSAATHTHACFEGGTHIVDNRVALQVRDLRVERPEALLTCVAYMGGDWVWDFVWNR